MPSPGMVARFTRARRSIEKLRRIGMLDRREYMSSEDTLYVSERLLQILLQAILDIAGYVAARLGIARGPTYKDVIDAIVEYFGLEEEMARLAESIPGMRNILVHGYTRIRHDLIYDTVRTRLDDLEELLLMLWREASRLDP